MDGWIELEVVRERVIELKERGSSKRVGGRKSKILGFFLNKIQYFDIEY